MIVCVYNDVVAEESDESEKVSVTAADALNDASEFS